MKNSKKPFIYEKAKRKLSKLFTYISANRFGIIKRAFGVTFTLAFACSLAFPFISNNKAQALSLPNGNDSTIYSTPFASSFLSVYGLSTSDSLGQGGGYYIDINQTNKTDRKGGARAYTTSNNNNRYIGSSVDSFVSTGALENRYYDSGDSDFFLTQNFGYPFDFFIATYRTSSLSIINEKSDLIYLPSYNYLSDIKVWFQIPKITIQTIKNYISINENHPISNSYLTHIKSGENYPSIVQETIDGGYIPVRLKMSLSYSVRNAKGDLVDYEITTYNYFNSMGMTYYEGEFASFNSEENINIIKESLATGIQKNKCYLIENLQLNCTMEQMCFDYIYYGGWTNSYNNGEADYNHAGWTFNSDYLPNTTTFATMYLKLPVYAENFIDVQTRLANANNLYLAPMWVDEQTIYGFWAKFMEIEILPNFKLTYLILIAFAFTLLTIFVRFFR